MSDERLRIRAVRRGRICVVALNGPLDTTTSAGLTDCVRTERAARPDRLVIDMSGVGVVDSSGAKALAAVARPAPGQCPVVIRSLRPAARRQLELAGLDMSWPGHQVALTEGRPRGGDGALAESATGILVRDWKHVLGAAKHTIADSHRTALSLAMTEDHVAATLLRLGSRRPASSARLEALSQIARDYAAMLRDRERPAFDLPVNVPGPRPHPVSGTVGLAIAFIKDRARDDISVADIAAASFVTIRAVQLAFRRHLDTTPLGYLRQVRLEYAHDQLMASDSDRTTVTAVAADWHFSNASRFSGHYRAAYGVPPVQTLRERHAED